MYKFSEQSKQKLATCDGELQRVFNGVIQHVDCTVISGYRGQAEQDELFRRGLSKLKFPNSRHCCHPSYAVDVALYHRGEKRIRWNVQSDHIYFGGYVMGFAAAKGIGLRWGGDWNGNHDIKDENFLDFVHFELRKD